MWTNGVGNTLYLSGDTKQTHTPSIQATPIIGVRDLETADILPGRILWLPPKEDLPAHAVKRAHGRGAIDEGIYDHPIVIISRPRDEPRVIHFHLITSLQGKRLDQVYDKPNEFHTSRRTWYLPVAPTPDHPDATSKKSKKRFPTLDLADSAVLRWNSYVNIRHVYKIDWALLRSYSNPDIPNITSFRFRRESFVRLLSKGRILTTYEPGAQLFESFSSSVAGSGEESTEIEASKPTDYMNSGIPRFTAGTAISGLYRSGPSDPQSDFHKADSNDNRIANRVVKVPPDIDREPMTLPVSLQHFLERCALNMKEGKVVFRKKLVNSPELMLLTTSVAQTWVTAKSVTAVIIASI